VKVVFLELHEGVVGGHYGKEDFQCMILVPTLFKDNKILQILQCLPMD
jgi:hypothetical protein